MIARLAGILLEKNPPHLVIDVNGVGYEVEAPNGVFNNLPENGKTVAILIHHHFSQDSQTLYGFASLGERELFRKLLKVNGIGAKLALSILSGASGDELTRFVSTGDVAALTRIPGIGKKTAQKFLFELKDKLAVGLEDAPISVFEDVNSDVIDTLVALGYSIVEAQTAVQNLPHDAPDDVEERVRLALQYFV